MTPKHITFIINPKAGVEREKEVKAAITAQLNEMLYSYDIQYTQRPKHGTELAREAAAKRVYAVVAVGGDGSVNDVAQGLIGTNTLLAILPKGSGNGLARNMKIPLNIFDAMRVINAGRIVTIDVGFANGVPFVSNAGVAFDALIARKFATSNKRGFAVYSWLVTKYMWLYRAMDFDITVDGQQLKKEKAFMVNVANGQQFGYNFKIAPMANYSDGWLDVVVIRSFPKILGALIAWRAMNGNIGNSRYFKHLRGKEITISHPKLKLMQVDGDAHDCPNSVSFSIQKGVLNVIAP